MKSIPFLAVLLLAWAGFAQEHAPLAAQCQADLGLWSNVQQRIEYRNAETEHFSNGTPNKSEINKLSFREIASRAHEMGQCADVDPPRRDDYNNAVSFYVEVLSDRKSSFIDRHHLMHQLIAEDEAGRR